MEYSQAQQQQIASTQYAGVGVRFLALLIDGILIGVVSGIINGVAAVTHSSLIQVIAAIVIIILVLFYHIGMEATQGATLGKKALGLRVTKTDGTLPGWSASLIRNLLRIIDGLFAYLVGAIIIWNSPLKQRLGDKAAHTVVIRTR
jgi:uncharacterized RDD family membrane protein YckC